jgi:hypothetical protein
MRRRRAISLSKERRTRTWDRIRESRVMWRYKIGSAGALVLVGCYALYVVSGLACVTFGRVSLPKLEGDNTMFCLRVARKDTHVVVEVPMGVPVYRVRLLLRLDRVVESHETWLRVISERIMESGSLRCGGVAFTCNDVLLVTKPFSDAVQERRVVRFTYENRRTMGATSVRANSLGLDGEMFAMRGYTYRLFSTHVCLSYNAVEGVEVAPPRAGERQLFLQGNVNEHGELKTNASSIGTVPSLHTSAVYEAYRDGLLTNSTSVELFPVAAASEASYLALNDVTMYETVPDAVRVRRRLVELGTNCIINLVGEAWTAVKRAYDLYLVDCASLRSCRTDSSIPFRRVADTTVYIRYESQGDTTLSFVEDGTLFRLTDNAERNRYAITSSVVKLTTLALAAAVVFVRTTRTASSIRWLYHRHLVAGCESDESGLPKLPLRRRNTRRRFGMPAVSPRLWGGVDTLRLLNGSVHNQQRPRPNFRRMYWQEMDCKQGRDKKQSGVHLSAHVRNELGMEQPFADSHRRMQKANKGGCGTSKEDA